VIVIQLILTAALAGLMIYAWRQRGLAAAIRLGLYAVILVGIFLVWVPEASTEIAHLVGVGRGADLLMYLWIVLSFVLILNLHLKLKANMRLLTQLSRHVAISLPFHPSESSEPAGEQGGSPESGPR